MYKGKYYTYEKFGGRQMSKVEKSRGFDRKVRKEKAITLIALVITIIVLLILADHHIFLNIPQ